MIFDHINEKINGLVANYNKQVKSLDHFLLGHLRLFIYLSNAFFVTIIFRGRHDQCEQLRIHPEVFYFLALV